MTDDQRKELESRLDTRYFSSESHALIKCALAEIDEMRHNFRHAEHGCVCCAKIAEEKNAEIDGLKADNAAFGKIREELVFEIGRLNTVMRDAAATHSKITTRQDRVLDEMTTSKGELVKELADAKLLLDIYREALHEKPKPPPETAAITEIHNRLNVMEAKYGAAGLFALLAIVEQKLAALESKLSGRTIEFVSGKKYVEIDG